MTLARKQGDFLRVLTGEWRSLAKKVAVRARAGKRQDQDIVLGPVCEQHLSTVRYPDGAFGLVYSPF